MAEDAPITLTLQTGFHNWRGAYLHKKATQLSDLSPINIRKVREVVEDIYEGFQISSSYIVKIEWFPASPTRNHDARKHALTFLKNKGAVEKFEFYYCELGIDSSIHVEINIEQFQLFKTELLKLPEDQFNSDASELRTTPPTQKKDPSKPFQHLRWESLSIQFLDGNNVKISDKDTKTPVTAHYKEMGFEDARSRKPDRQWALLQLLAENNGELSWDKSEAKGDIKKKKQLLSKTLRDYFGIKGDPFYPYKEQNSYRIKISLTPESDSQ